MKKRVLIVFLMILWDLSLHIVELINKVSFHPLYPIFPLFNVISYDIFWTSYWGIGFIILATLIMGGKKENEK